MVPRGQDDELPAPDETPPPVPTPTLEPTPTIEPTPTPEPTSTPDPTPMPKPGGPTELRVAPATEDVAHTYAGTNARFAIEIEPQGNGLPDAKEFRVKAPDGWEVRLLDEEGVELRDHTDNDQVDTEPLAPGVAEPITVEVAVPDDAPTGTEATIDLQVQSLGDPSPNHEDGLALTVVVQADPTPTPPSDAAAVSHSQEPNETAEKAETSESTVGAFSEKPSSSLAAGEQPVSSPAPREIVAPEVTIALDGGQSRAVAPGQWIDLRYVVTVDGVAEPDDAVSLFIEAGTSADWSVEILDVHCDLCLDILAVNDRRGAIHRRHWAHSVHARRASNSVAKCRRSANYARRMKRGRPWVGSRRWSRSGPSSAMVASTAPVTVS
ncbi:MAG: hypothetical protein ACRDJH_24955 [Thermomicrobiales bacterium]